MQQTETHWIRVPPFFLNSTHHSWVVDFYNFRKQQWKNNEPSKLSFISHYLWKKKEPTFSDILDELDRLEEEYGFDEMIRRIKEWQTN